MRNCWKLAKEQKKVENITSNTMKGKVLFKMCTPNYMHLEEHENRVHHHTLKHIYIFFHIEYIKLRLLEVSCQMIWHFNVAWKDNDVTIFSHGSPFFFVSKKTCMSIQEKNYYYNFQVNFAPTSSTTWITSCFVETILPLVTYLSHIVLHILWAW